MTDKLPDNRAKFYDLMELDPALRENRGYMMYEDEAEKFRSKYSNQRDMETAVHLRIMVGTEPIWIFGDGLGYYYQKTQYTNNFTW